MITEISESAKLAEQYHGKIVECSTRIDSCMAQVHDLSAKLSTCNNQLAASAQQSLGIIRSSVGPAESTSRPNVLLASAILEVEQLKIEQLQLSKRYDRLLAFLRMYAQQQMEQNGDTGLLGPQDIDLEPDRVFVSDVNANRRMTSAAGLCSATAMPSQASAIQRSPVNLDDVVMSDASDGVVVGSSYTSRTPSPKKSSGVVQRSRSAKPAVVRRAQSTVVRQGRKSSATNRKSPAANSSVRSSSQGTVNRRQQASGVSQSLTPVTTQITSSLDNNVNSTRTEFKTPQPRPRGRQRQTHPGVAVRANSADSSLRSRTQTDVVETNTVQIRRDDFSDVAISKSADMSVPSASAPDLPDAVGSSEPEPEVVVTRRRRRPKSAAQAGDVASNAVRVRRDDVAISSSADDLVTSGLTSHLPHAAVSSEPESEATVTRRRRRPKSAAQAGDVASNTVQVLQDNVNDVAISNSASDSVPSTLLHHPLNAAVSSEPEPEVTITRRCRRPKSAAQAGDVQSNTVQGVHRDHADNVVSSNSTNDSVPSTVCPHPLHAAVSCEPKPEVVTRRHRRTKSATQANDVGSNTVQVSRDGVAVSSSADDSIPSTLLPHSLNTAASSEPQPEVTVVRRCRTKSAAKNTHVASAAAVAAPHNVNHVNSTEDVLQSAVLSDSSQAAGGTVKSGSRRRTKSVEAFSIKKTLGVRQTGSKIVPRRSRGPRRSLVAADVDAVDVTKPAQHRSNVPRIPVTASAGRRKNYSIPANVVRSPTSLSVNAASPSTSPSSPHRPVTTWLSGPRTDIFRQHPLQSTASVVRAVNGAISLSAKMDDVDDEISFKLPVSANSSKPTRYATILFYLS